MRTIPGLTAASLLLLVTAGTGAAETPEARSTRMAATKPLGLMPGERIRFRTRERPQSPFEVVYAGVRKDSLYYGGYLLEKAPQRVAVVSVTSLERSAGKHGHAWTGIGIGLLVGVGVGALIGSQYAEDDPGFGGLHIAVGAIGGGAAGMLVGGVVGASIRTERWIPVSADVSAAARRSVDIGVSLHY
ncbi:MAG: hypothetical protein ACM3PF_15005 [Bacteroidota bacterium]